MVDGSNSRSRTQGVKVVYVHDLGRNVSRVKEGKMPQGRETVGGPAIGLLCCKP
jgi:hypothetical protein